MGWDMFVDYAGSQGDWVSSPVTNQLYDQG